MLSNNGISDLSSSNLGSVINKNFGLSCDLLSDGSLKCKDFSGVDCSIGGCGFPSLIFCITLRKVSNSIW